MPYLGVGHHYGLVSDMAYHNELMVQLWNSLATGGAEMAQVALAEMPLKPTSATWATYVRCHDDIGWAISDHDAEMVGVTGFEHRKYLSDFYSGAFPGSFARGLVFQENPVTGDRRISGSCASLAGLEKAVEEGDEEAVELAVARIALMYAVISGYGGVPLLYMGDELGMFNDMHYVDDPSHAEDNRWAHRPFMDWDLAKAVETDTASPAGRVNAAIRHILAVRTATTQIHAATPSVPVESPEHRLLILERNHPLGKMVQVYNFTGETVSLRHDVLAKRVGFDAHELLGGYDWDLRLPRIDFAPYQAAWFVGAEI